MRRKTHTHTPSELISDFICCALQVHLFLILQIKGRCNGGDWWVILVIHDPRFFFPNDFCWFSYAVNHDKDSFCEFILHSSWYTPIVYVFVNLFVQCDLLCLFALFFSQPDVVNITRITGLIHRSIVDKIDPTSKDVEMVKNTRSITLGCIFLSLKSWS